MFKFRIIYLFQSTNIRKMCTNILTTQPDRSANELIFSREIFCDDVNRQKCMSLLKKGGRAPQIKLTPKDHSHDKTAAVLVPICEQNNELCLLYTQRSAKLKQHNREVSFPGGIRDATDESYEACALRETEEEIGIDRSRIDVWGTGTLIYPHQRPTIMPVIGFIDNVDGIALKVNKAEVEKVFLVPIRQLCLQKYQKHTQFRRGFSAPVFVGTEERIWGITAAVTSLFLQAFLPRELYNHKMHFVSKYKD